MTRPVGDCRDKKGWRNVAFIIGGKNRIKPGTRTKTIVKAGKFSSKLGEKGVRGKRASMALKPFPSFEDNTQKQNLRGGGEGQLETRCGGRKSNQKRPLVGGEKIQQKRITGTGVEWD